MARKLSLIPVIFPAVLAVSFSLLLSATPILAAGHDYHDALRKSILFFEGQRSGRLPPDQRVRWRRDSALRDGSTAGVDLTGGYYDAGDNVKFGFPMAFTTTLLAWSIIDFGRNMGPELKNAVKAVKWSTDYLLKATAKPGVVYVQVGDAYSDHSCWERPEDMDTLRTVYKIDNAHPGSDVAGETAAALAAASIVFRSRDPAYSRLLLNRAVRVFNFADKHRGAYSSSLHAAVCPFYCDVNGYQDELLWAAAWLHKASRRRGYREYIVKNEVILRAGDTINEFGWDNKHAGINVLISKGPYGGVLCVSSIIKPKFCAELEGGIKVHKHLNFRDLVFPSGGPPCMCLESGATEVLMGKAEYFESFKQNADGFICSLLPGISHPQVQYSPASPALLKQLAKRQVNYILGDNPLGMSYMVGYGPRFPRRIHHRGSSLPSVAAHPARIGCKAGSQYYSSPNPNPNLLVGAVVGGPNVSDAFPDSRSYFQESEPTTYINAPLVGLLAFFSAHP
ncbi:hypothetical protein V6N12_006112 [Hibiscus sabdariffa]|uniref:Endoglucanase n=1 Tax=Hibiscus sabdariffa TaxID=183260 RepID=A0ABR2EX19_9ROSI